MCTVCWTFAVRKIDYDEFYGWSIKLLDGNSQGFVKVGLSCVCYVVSVLYSEVTAIQEVYCTVLIVK